MGRQVYTYIKDPQGNIVWSSAKLEGIDCEHDDTYFCGRNDETNIIAYNADCETDELNITDSEAFQSTLTELQEHQDRMDAELARLDDRIDALKHCRSNAMNYTIFEQFDDALDDAYETRDDIYWTRAGDMIELMQRTRAKAEEIVGQANGYRCGHDLAGYTIYWRNDE